MLPWRRASARRQMSSEHSSQMTSKNVFIYGAPIVAGLFFLIWYILPIGWVLAISFWDYSPIGASNEVIGLQNYREALFQDHVFWAAVRNTAYFTFGNVVLGTILALLIANGLSRLGSFRRMAQTAYFMPTLFSVVAAAVVWEEIFQPRFGILNNGLYYLTDLVGLPPFPEIGWTTTTEWSMPTVILFGLWKFLGIRIIILLAAIEAVPRDLYEAASLEGVTRRQQFLFITIPMIKPALWFVAIAGIINSFQVFEPMYVITDGGPLRSSISMVMLVAETAFERQRFGYSAAISILLFAMILTLTAVLFWLRSRSEEQ